VCHSACAECKRNAQNDQDRSQGSVRNGAALCVTRTNGSEGSSFRIGAAAAALWAAIGTGVGAIARNQSIATARRDVN
jgi:hypothetical protein